jgi:hypothetical protein
LLNGMRAGEVVADAMMEHDGWKLNSEAKSSSSYQIRRLVDRHLCDSVKGRNGSRVRLDQLQHAPQIMKVAGAAGATSRQGAEQLMDAKLRRSLLPAFPEARLKREWYPAVPALA